MTTGTLLKHFAKDTDLAPLLAERELRFLKERRPDSELSEEDIRAVITLCDRIEKALVEDEELLTSFETELEELGEEIESLQ